MGAELEHLTPDDDPPSRSSRWCPRCRCWYERTGSRRCLVCGTAVVRPAFRSKLKPGELRPGVIAEFDDPRDRYNPARELASMRARLTR